MVVNYYEDRTRHNKNQSKSVHIKWAANPITERVRDIDPKNNTAKFKKRLKTKPFPSHRSDKRGVRQGRQAERKTDRQRDEKTDRRADAGNENNPDLKVVGKNQHQWVFTLPKLIDFH